MAGRARRPGAGGCRCRDRPRRCDASRRGRAPRLADDGAALARGPARPRHPTARHLPRLPARRPSGRSGGLPLGGVRGRLVSGRVHARRGGRPRRRARCPHGSTPSSGITTRTHSPPARSSWPAARSAPRPTGSENAWGVQFHPEVRAEQVEEWLAEDPADVTDAEGLRRETRERIDGWNELGRGLCRAFLAAA